MPLPLKNSLNLSALTTITALLTLAVFPVDAGELSPDLINRYTSVNPFSFILLEFGLIIILALVGHILSRHYRLSFIIGELLIGIVAGNILYWLDWSPVFYMLMHIGDVGEVFKSIWTSNLSVSDTVDQLYTVNQPESKEFVNRMSEVFTSSKSPALVLLGVALRIFSSLGVFLLLFKLGSKLKRRKLSMQRNPWHFWCLQRAPLFLFFLVSPLLSGCCRKQLSRYIFL